MCDCYVDMRTHKLAMRLLHGLEGGIVIWLERKGI